MLENITSVGGMSPSFLDNDLYLSNDFNATFQSMDGASLGNALGKLTQDNVNNLGVGMELLSPFVQNLSPIEQVKFEQALSPSLQFRDDCGGAWPYGGEPMKSKVYAIPPGFRATNMDPTHRLVLNANGVLVNNPNYQKALDAYKTDWKGVVLDLVIIATGAVGVPVTGVSGGALVVGSAAAAGKEINDKSKL